MNYQFPLQKEVLARAPGDAEAKECKVTALIQAGDISQALQTIESSQTPSLDFRFHKVLKPSLTLQHPHPLVNNTKGCMIWFSQKI